MFCALHLLYELIQPRAARQTHTWYAFSGFSFANVGLKMFGDTSSYNRTFQAWIILIVFVGGELWQFR